MYAIMKTIIGNGKYELEDMINRIDAMYAKGRIGLEEMDELKKMARENAKAENSYAPLQEQVDKAFELIAILQKQIDEIKRTAYGEAEEETEEYPEWKKPTGAHDAYYAGMQMTYTDGKHYTCIAPEGIACVWGPDVMTEYWKEE